MNQEIFNQAIVDSNESVTFVPFKVVSNDLNGKVITKEYGSISLARVFKSKYQKDNTLTAEIKQKVKVTTTYQGSKHKSDLNDNPFATMITPKTETFTNTQTRVMWIDVPNHLNEDQVRSHLANFPEATIYVVLDNEPILSDLDRSAIESGLITLDDKADSQVVRYHEDHEKSGQICLDPYGQLQYRRACFSSQFTEDKDYRVNNNPSHYISAVLHHELQISRNS